MGRAASSRPIWSRSSRSGFRSAIPGGFFSFTQPIIDNVTEAVTGSPADLAVIITGSDLAELRRLATQTLGGPAQVPGAADTGIEQEEDQAQLRLRLDRQALARYGINVRDVQDVIELAIGGRTVSTFFEGERRFDITVRYMPEARTDPSAHRHTFWSRRATAAGCRSSQLARASRSSTARASSRGARTSGRSRSAPTSADAIRAASWPTRSSGSTRASRCLPATGGLGRPVRKPRARAAAPRVHPAGDDRRDLRPALLHVRLVDRRRTGAAERPVLARRRHRWRSTCAGSISASRPRSGFISLFGVAVMSGVLVVSDINRRRRENGPTRRTPSFRARSPRCARCS